MNRITRTVASTLALALTAGVVVAGAPAAGAQTSNDSFSSALVLPSEPTGQVSGDNVGTTLEAGETSIGGVGGSSVHYSIVAPATGPLQVTTLGSSYDTVLGIGTGDSVASFALLAENDDIDGTLQSQVSIDAVQGQTYRIVVDGYDGAQGEHVLNWNIAVETDNDAFATPTTLASEMAGQVAGDNNGASLEAGEARVADVGGSSVHYSIVAPVTGTLVISTDGSDYDSALGAGQGTSAADLDFAAQNDDVEAGVLTSEVTLDVVEGESYRIVVDGYEGAQGNHTLAWAFIAAPDGGQPPVGEGASEFLSLINEARSQARSCGGQFMPAVGALVSDPLLAASSEAHSNDMATSGLFSHTGSDGSSFTERAQRFGTSANTENIAAGQRNVAAAVQGWIDSPGHCRNIMNADATRVGLGLVVNPDSQFSHFWTMMTGR